MTQSKRKQQNASKRNNTKRKGASRPARRKTTIGRAPSTSSITHRVCGITDPFCQAAYGAKQPDSGSIRTLAFQSVTLWTQNTDSSGRAAIMCGPHGFKYGLTFTGSVVDTWYATELNYNSVSTFSSVSQWRVVSYGIEVFQTASPMDSSGIIGIAVLPADKDQVTINGIDFQSQTLASNVYVPCNAHKSIAAIAMQDGKDSKLFNDWSAAGAGLATSNGNDVLIAYINGGKASSGIFQVKVTVNYELNFPKESYFNRIATAPAVPAPQVDAGKAFVARTMNQVVVGGSSELQKRVHSAAEAFGRSLVRGAGALIGGYIGGPAGAYAGGSAASMIMDVD